MGKRRRVVPRDNDLFVIRIFAEDTINQYFAAKKKIYKYKADGVRRRESNVDSDFIKRRLGLLKGS